MPEAGKERIQKTMARLGNFSRREAEDLVRQGEVTLNGKLAQVGAQVDLADSFSIKVRGQLLQANPISMKKRYLAFYKPRGVISMFTKDPSNRPTLSDYFRTAKARVFPVGRLAFNDEGLLLLTNDGAFSEEIQEKMARIPRKFRIKVKGHVTDEQIARAQRTPIPGSKKRADEVRVYKTLKSKTVIEAVFTHRKPIDVKTWSADAGLLQERIYRIAMGGLSVDSLKPGESKPLEIDQIRLLALGEKTEK